MNDLGVREEQMDEANVPEVEEHLVDDELDRRQLVRWELFVHTVDDLKTRRGPARRRGWVSGV